MYPLEFRQRKSAQLEKGFIRNYQLCETKFAKN